MMFKELNYFLDDCRIIVYESAAASAFQDVICTLKKCGWALEIFQT